MKRLLFSLIPFYLTISQIQIFSHASSTQDYHIIIGQWTDNWMNQWSSLVPYADDACALNYMLNFLYISYQRSYATIAVQKLFLPMYQHMNESIYDVVKRRRNTSKQQEFLQTLANAVDDMAEYVACHKRYQAVMNYHAQASDDVLKNGCLGNEMLAALAAELHAYTRTVIMCYAGDVKSYMHHMKSLLHTAHDTTGSSSVVDRSLLGYLEDAFPSLAFNAFVKMDNALISATKISHQLNYDIQASAVCVWEAIETARGNFYHTMYVKLYAYAASRGIYGTHMYDIPTDLVSCQDTVIPLPQP